MKQTYIIDKETGERFYLELTTDKGILCFLNKGGTKHKLFNKSEIKKKEVYARDIESNKLIRILI